MDFGIKGRVAMVAAATEGIGFAIAKALAAEGCVVSICGRTREKLDHAVRDLGDPHVGYLCDVSHEADLVEWYRQTSGSIGSPTIMVTNTGGPPPGHFSDLSEDQWMAGVHSTLMPCIRLVKLAAPAMMEQGFGRIVHITSLVAKESEPILTISSTLRAGIMALTKLQAQEFGHHGITVNGVLPGHTMTARQVHLAEVRAERDGMTVAQALEYQAERVPMGRMAEPHEVAAAAAFLCSAPASYVSGVSLLVDGASTSALG